MANQAKFDKNRGCVIKFYRLEGDLQARQMCQYDDDPGVYYFADGSKASEAQARKAGFNVENDKKLAEATAEYNEKKDALQNALRELRGKGPRGIMNDAEALDAAIEADGDAPHEPKMIDSELRESPNFEMKHNKSTKLWDVFEKESGDVYAEGLEKRAASQMIHDDVHNAA